MNTCIFFIKYRFLKWLLFMWIWLFNLWTLVFVMGSTSVSFNQTHHCEPCISDADAMIFHFMLSLIWNLLQLIYHSQSIIVIEHRNTCRVFFNDIWPKELQSIALFVWCIAGNVPRIYLYTWLLKTRTKPQQQ